MNPVRPFVFAMAFLRTAFHLRQVVDYLSSEQPIHVAVAANGAAMPPYAQRVADKGSL